MAIPQFSWLSPDVFKTLPNREKALLWAAHECDVLKVREDPPGSNRGEKVDEYEAEFGLKGQPWCACFVAWCLRQAGFEKGKDFPNSALVADWRRWAIEKSVRQTAFRRGDLFYMVHRNGTGHIGFVANVNGDRLETIEGNTNDGGSREGIAVMRRIRSARELASLYQWGAIRIGQ